MGLSAQAQQTCSHLSASRLDPLLRYDRLSPMLAREQGSPVHRVKAFVERAQRPCPFFAERSLAWEIERDEMSRTEALG